MEEKTTNNSKVTNKQLEDIMSQLKTLMEITKKQEEENKSLREQVAELTSPKEVVEEAQAVVQFEDSVDSDRMVEIVHLLDNANGITTMLKLSDGRSLTFRKYGDTARVRYFELQQLLSLYHDLFYEDRVFTLGSKEEDVARIERLPTFDDKCLSKDEVRQLLELSTDKLISIYERVCDTHKDLILSTWQRGYYEGNDGRFRDIDKINALNKVSNQKLKTIYEHLTSK